MGAAQLGNVAGLTGQCHPWAGSCKVANTPVMALPMPPGNLRLQIQTSNQYAYYVFVPIGTREGTRRDPVFLKKKGTSMKIFTLDTGASNLFAGDVRHRSTLA
jgi:hypothetical protein